MGKPIQEIEGIGPAYGEKLAAAGIKSTDALLEQGGTPKGRKKIAEQCGLSEKQVLGWVNMADLFRVKGVAGEYAELLESSGVDTLKELAQRNAENLAAKLAEVNEQKKLTRKLPTASQVADWIAQAGTLPRKIEH
jgi:predicted flap endonuclease-1-like 5' DNA nuclease